MLNQAPRNKDVWGIGGIVLHILNLRPKWRTEVSFMLLLRYPGEGAPSSLWTGGWVGSSCGEE
jgi:hypothetical protein